MSTDRELLELAAKAAGEDPWFDENDKPIGWNPLEDDGDALRLAVKLGVNVHFIAGDGTFVSRYESEPVIAEKRGDDQYAAARRAIVRAAAEIWRALP